MVIFLVTVGVCVMVSNICLDTVWPQLGMVVVNAYKLIVAVSVFVWGALAGYQPHGTSRQIELC